MKNLIAMMNAMKYYNPEALIHENEEFQEKLSQNLPPLVYREMMGKIRGKFFVNHA